MEARISEANDAYNKAYKKGKWDIGRLVKSEKNELIALSDLVPDFESLKEQKVGLREVDIDRIIGTVYAGRTNSFTQGFMPIMDPESEFAIKWKYLYASFLDEGIRDAIKVYEYMGKYYVLEGNKRVSVLKYSNTPVALVDVYRKIPPFDENNPAVTIYYEYMHFEEVSGISNIYFKIHGNAEKLLAFVDEEKWSDITKENIRSYAYRIERIFASLRKKPENYRYGDVIVKLFSIFGYKQCMESDELTTKEWIVKAWSEISILDNPGGASVLTDQSDLTKNTLLSGLLGNKSIKELKVAFIYGDNLETSRYVMAHDKGRLSLIDTFGDKIETVIYNNIISGKTGHEITQTIEDSIIQAIDEGCKLIFTTEGYMAEPALKIALEHPECYILNCSLDHEMSAVRCYQVRMYEIKFLLGAIAAQISDTDIIGYEADLPSYGNIASINAFARGAKLINPKAKVELIWTHTVDYQGTRFDTDKVNVILGSDVLNPKNINQPYGLYINKADNMSLEDIGLAAISIQWGRFYEKILLSILDGNFNPKASNKAVNYWWGFEEGVVQIVKSRRLPESVRRLNNILTKGIVDGSLSPFTGTIINQQGDIITKHGGLMSLSEIMKINYLEDNVIGEIPTVDKLNKKAQLLLGYFEEKNKEH